MNIIPSAVPGDYPHNSLRFQEPKDHQTNILQWSSPKQVQDNGTDEPGTDVTFATSAKYPGVTLDSLEEDIPEPLFQHAPRFYSQQGHDNTRIYGIKGSHGVGPWMKSDA
jgi:hypothetical protein